MDEHLRDKVLERFTEAEKADIANACNSYPILQVEFALDTEKAEPGQSITLTVQINRDNEVC